MSSTTAMQLTVNPVTANNNFRASILRRLYNNDPTLTELDLAWSWSFVGLRYIRSLVRALVKNTVLVKLNLSNNRLGVQEIRVLAPALARSTSLATLDLSDNGFGAAGMEALVPALAGNTKLTELHLNGNALEDEGVEILASVLNNILHTLSLSNNNIQSAGMEALASVLARSASLATLDLSRNDINSPQDDGFISKGVKVLAEGLKKNTVLGTLILDHNALGPKGMEVLASALEENKMLFKLFLEGDQCGSQFNPYLQMLIIRNEQFRTNWARTALAMAFAKANKGSHGEMRYSVLPHIESIVKLADSAYYPVASIGVACFTHTTFFKAHLENKPNWARAALAIAFAKANKDSDGEMCYSVFPHIESIVKLAGSFEGEKQSPPISITHFTHTTFFKAHLLSSLNNSLDSQPKTKCDENHLTALTFSPA